METPVEVQRILLAAAEQHRITVDRLLSKDRDREVVAARRTAVRALRGDPFRCSLPEIGRHLGGKDHSSVLYLLRTESPLRKRPLYIPKVDIGKRAASDLERSLAEVETHRSLLRASLEELDELECQLNSMLTALRSRKPAA